MSCYITYKGKNYTQEDFLDYLKSLLPNTEIKEGVSEVYQKTFGNSTSIQYSDFGTKTASKNVKIDSINGRKPTSNKNEIVAYRGPNTASMKNEEGLVKDLEENRMIGNPSVEPEQISQPKVDIKAKVYELFNLQGYIDIKTSHKTDKKLITYISHYVLEDLGYKTDQEKLQAIKDGFKLSEYITTEQISDTGTRVRLNIKNILEDEVDSEPISLGGIKFTSSGYESDAKNAFTCK